MNAAATPDCCTSPAAGTRCTAALPDNPQCAPNYHFGMLLGVEDFRAEQGFHVGRLRRHQRLLHGSGVVAGFPVTFDAASGELRVGPGHALDALGRDLMLEQSRCVSLPLWWAKHRDEEGFDDIEPGTTLFSLDIVACYSACLDRPVPAIAEPCAGDSADIAHSRICETVVLKLVRPTASPAAPANLVQVWLGQAEPARDVEGELLPDHRWLSEALAALSSLSPPQRASARQTLLPEVLARSIAATSPFAPPSPAMEHPHCLRLARLDQVRILADGEGWRVELGELRLGVRDSLLPTAMLQALVLHEPADIAAGPRVSSASLAGDRVALVFDHALAAASVAPAAFALSAFDATTGWTLLTVTATSIDDSDPAAPVVGLVLDQAPSGHLLRITVIGTGSAPLLGLDLIPAGAASADSDGRDLTTTVSIQG